MFRLPIAALVAACSFVVSPAHVRPAHACEAHEREGALLIKAQHSPGTSPAPAQIKLGALVIEAPWTRATPAGAKVAGGFMTITNTGKEPDRLVGGSFPLAGRFEVHEMAVTNGVMTMRELSKGVEIAPGAKIEFKPGGFHVMFMDLKSQVREGQPIRGTLVFEKAGTVEIEYRIAPIGARAPAGAHVH